MRIKENCSHYVFQRAVKMNVMESIVFAMQYIIVAI